MPASARLCTSKRAHSVSKLGKITIDTQRASTDLSLTRVSSSSLCSSEARRYRLRRIVSPLRLDQGRAEGHGKCPLPSASNQPRAQRTTTLRGLVPLEPRQGFEVGEPPTAGVG